MKKSRLLKKSIFITCIIIIIMIAFFEMIKYEVEGERSLPYNISKIFVVSTVEGTQVDDEENIWNINVKQVNDLYFYIDKNGVTEDTIKQITIENFNVIKSPVKGEVAIYRPTGELKNLYTYSQQNYINESITYTGDRVDDLKTLEVANNGGVIALRVSLDNLGAYISSDSTEITYDGKLLENIGISIEEIKFSLSFDVLIETNKNITYKGTVTINLPSDDVIKEGSSSFDITDFENVVFKRI